MAAELSLTFWVELFTSSVTVAISFTLFVISLTLSAAICMFEDMLPVTADCSSMAAEIMDEISLILVMVSVMVWMAVTASLVVDCTSAIWLLISSVALAVCPASDFTISRPIGFIHFANSIKTNLLTNKIFR